MIDELKNVPSKIAIEQFDVNTFSKDKIRDLFRTGKVPTAEVMVDEIILRALKAGATDLHFEPADQELRVRLGTEGVLAKLVSLPKDISENLASVMKTKASLNAFEKKKPQEGRFSLTIGTQQYDFRISTVPVLAGERIAVRIFPKNGNVAKIEELGFSTDNLEKVRRILRRPNGLCLISGSSSSGKSTTAYAAISDLQSVEKNIFTVENPIEYKLDFASQVAASSEKGFTFVDALRSILRQNPNIIMVGEIRDAETGVVAAEAALTGNLVLSTMLAGDAIGTIYRLINLGVPPYWLSSTLIGVVYQQLVRKICQSCKEEYESPQALGAKYQEASSGQTKFYRGKGCEKCSKTGYSGRTAIQEVLAINEEMSDLIYQGAGIFKIREAAQRAGFHNIYSDAGEKAARGVTSIDELSRALG